MKTASLAILALIIQTQTGTQTPTIKSAKDKEPDKTTATYTNDELGLAFEHPKTWKQSKVKVKNDQKIVLLDPKSWRPPSVETTSRFLLPLPAADERAKLEIFSAAFFQDEDTWQTVQRDINDKMKRTVLRQWSEEVLGVPLLMTKIESKDKGVDLITETGLMYSATPRKLIFRLTSSPDNFDKADYEWRQSLQTLHTTDNHLPSAESPNRKIGPAELQPGSFHKVIWTPPVAAQLPVAKGPITAEGTAGGKKVILRVAAGWKVQKNADGSFMLSSPALSGMAKVVLASLVDSDAPGKALLKSSGQTLQGFSKVDKREERPPFSNRGQAMTDYIYRRGVAGAKPMFGFDAAGVSGDNYWILSWTGSDSGNALRDRRTLESLAEIMSIDATP